MLAEVISQHHLLAGLIDKGRVERKRLVQMLRHCDLLQYLRQLIPGILTALLVAVA